MTRVLRCAACTKRIKPHHAHIGLIDHESSREIAYHAHPNCQKRAAEEMASLLGRGRVYILRRYHRSSCPDDDPGFGCRGGCFDTPLELAN